MNNTSSNGDVAYTSRNKELYFRDEERRIDYVLAYRLCMNDKHKIRRALFLDALAKQDIHIEVEDCVGNLLGATFDKEYQPDETDPQSTSNGSSISPCPMSDLTIKTDWNSETSDKNAPPSAMERYRFQGMKRTKLVTGQDNLVFVKLHVPWEVITYYAEFLKLSKPLRLCDDHRDRSSTKMKLFSCLDLPKEIRRNETFTFTMPFTRAKEYLFAIPPDRDMFFTPSERAYVADYILRRTGFKDSLRALSVVSDERTTDDRYLEDFGLGDEFTDYGLEELKDLAKNFGISKLINDEVFVAAYPLHQPSSELLDMFKRAKAEYANQQEPSSNIASDEFNNRILLEKYWASYKRCFCLQPISIIRRYFGEAVGFYFAWLGFYTWCLLPVALLGLTVFLFGLMNFRSHPVIDEVCKSEKTILMCPHCRQSYCKFWYLSSSCLRTRLMHLIDHEGTLVFTIVMSLWAALFLEMWKRKQARLAHDWKVSTAEPVAQPPRPEFLSLIERQYPSKINHATGYIEPVVPVWSRKIPIYIVSSFTVIVAILLTLGLLACFVFYKLAMKSLLYAYKSMFLQSSAGMLATMSASVINLIVILLLRYAYDRVASQLTDMENHRTQLQYDDSLALKLFLLQFVNYYCPLFYISFLQSATSALPGSRHLIIQSTGCDQGDCLFEVFTQLMIVMFGKQIINSIMEAIMPKFSRLYFQYKSKRERKKFEASQKQVVTVMTGPDEGINSSETVQKNLCCRDDFYRLDPGSRPLFNEYIEMMIQFGFITMFAPACPLAPLFALLNNVIEIRGDAKKFVHQYRRTVPGRVNTIGVWLSIISVITALAIRTNAFLIAFTTKFIERTVYRLWYSSDGTLDGYVEFTLSTMSTSRFESNSTEDYCRFPGHYHPPRSEYAYTYNAVHYQILAAKLAFVCAYEICIALLTSIIMVLVPDVPQSVTEKNYREQAAVKRITMDKRMRRSVDLICAELTESRDVGMKKTMLNFIEHTCDGRPPQSGSLVFKFCTHRLNEKVTEPIECEVDTMNVESQESA